MHICKKCGNKYKQFYSLKEHIYDKHNPVNNTLPLSEPKKPKKPNSKVGRPRINKCGMCNTMFSTRYSLERHINGRCKGMSQSNNSEPVAPLVFDPFDKSYMDAIADTMLAKLNSGNGNNGTNNKIGNIQEGGSHNSMVVNTDNHIENNITQNNALYIREVHINPIGKENLSHISDATILQILNQGTNAVPALAKAIMELPENCNIVESDKRNKKATVVNRDGDVEIMELAKALTMCATETVDRVDDFYEKFKDELPKQNKSIQRMARAHGLDSDEEEDDIPKDETYEAYFKKYTSQIKDNIDVNKKPIMDRINKYKDYKYKEKMNKAETPSLTS